MCSSDLDHMPKSLHLLSEPFHYKHEMTIEDHVELLETLDEHPGPVLLSGYAHPVYDDRLKDWKRITRDVTAEAGAKRQEVLWINPVAAEFGYQQQTLNL